MFMNFILIANISNISISVYEIVQESRDANLSQKSSRALVNLFKVLWHSFLEALL